MRLVRFLSETGIRAGRIENNEVIDTNNGASWALNNVKLLAPITPGKIIGIGLNYHDPAKPASASQPDLPVCFLRPHTCLAGPYDTITLPNASATLDYEGELGVVIGKPCRNIDVHAASNAIFGYVVVNDLTLREYAAPATLFYAKCADGSLPCGPCLVTADEIADPGNLTIETTVNGTLRQHGSTADMITGVTHLISLLSRFMTLEPGDLICTGSPPGTGISQNPPSYLTQGDQIRVSISGIGAIETTVRA